MPNWCSSSYVLVGSADEVKELYGIMKKLEQRKKVSIENGFGITWLGCLVDALGEDWKKVSCRGECSQQKRKYIEVYDRDGMGTL